MMGRKKLAVPMSIMVIMVVPQITFIPWHKAKYNIKQNLKKNGADWIKP